MGIPIDGTSERMAASLARKGFAQTYEYNGYVYLEGDFAGYDNCELTIFPMLPYKDCVTSISVWFNKHFLFLDAFKVYEDLQNALTKKYGKPYSVSTEQDKRKNLVFSFYSIPNGTIKLSVSCYEDMYQAYLIYYDDYNYNLLEKFKEEAKMNDL